VRICERALNGSLIEFSSEMEQKRRKNKYQVPNGKQIQQTKHNKTNEPTNSASAKVYWMCECVYCMTVLPIRIEVAAENALNPFISGLKNKPNHAEQQKWQYKSNKWPKKASDKRQLLAIKKRALI